MEAQRPKRKAAKDAEAAMKKSANLNGDSDDPDYEDKESGSDGGDTEWVGQDEEGGHDEDSEDGEDEDSDSDIDDLLQQLRQEQTRGVQCSRPRARDERG
jgi:hypothetical protein